MPIAFIHGDSTVVPPLGTSGVAIEQQVADLHHSIDLFMSDDGPGLGDQCV
jgi:hypothetical protein